MSKLLLLERKKYDFLKYIKILYNIYCILLIIIFITIKDIPPAIIIPAILLESDLISIQF